MGFTGIDAEMKRLKNIISEFEEDAVKDVKDTAMFLLEQLFSRTPVWEGTTVRNYNVAIGGFSSAFAQAVGGVEPGPTNLLPLGAEPRRAANEAAARGAAQAALTFKELRDVFISNSSPHADLIDMGDAPGGSNQRVRNPGGVSMIAAQSTRSARPNWK